MAANDNETAAIVKTKIIKSEQDEEFEEYPCSKKKSRSKMLTTKRDKPQIFVETASPRIAELARPTKQHVLNTLYEKATALPPAFVDNLVKIIEAESCLTPEKATWIRRQRERRIKKAARLPLVEKRTAAEKITDDVARATTLDRDATMYQYLLAERFVKSILEYRREMRENIRTDIADVIMKRLMSLNGYANVKNGDRATQQLRLLADVITCWFVDISDEVEKTKTKIFKKHDEKRLMRTLEVNKVTEEVTLEVNKVTEEVAKSSEENRIEEPPT
ncbi:PREDICTED: uncharacterized protein LOC105458602 [Wasmannia auropunctata]|uniref:uncharacterized protein LOC105458602 n=1 Tax=Wasmannia auropunctata TaxID=64793 RepID=UPI0005ED59C2|nr:PREDICTED: uncharacterized protein LOC105458602 [Wasmannia auropunctata]